MSIFTCSFEKCKKYSSPPIPGHKACYYGDTESLCWKGFVTLFLEILKLKAGK